MYPRGAGGDGADEGPTERELQHAVQDALLVRRRVREPQQGQHRP